MSTRAGADKRLDALVTLAHGSGGRVSADFIQERLAPAFAGLGEMDDAAVLKTGGSNIAFTTDSFVVDPLFFPGGDIGRLAVFGTVNDLASQGAKPRWLSLAIVAPEGFSLATLDTIIASVAAAAREAGVIIVTGDTKVVEKRSLEGLILNTAGIGEIIDGADLSAARLAAGDIIIVSGHVGAHEMAVLSRRHDLGFEKIRSDCGPICDPAGALIAEFAGAVKWMRDPTRGGLATVLNELAVAAGAAIDVDEELVPIKRAVQDGADILGLDPLYMACEGRLVAVVDAAAAESAVRILKEHSAGAGSAVIGAVTAVGGNSPRVQLNTKYGSRRILRYLAADQQPRIC